MDSHFVTIFDISQKPADWNMMVIPILFFIGGTVFAIWGFRTRRGFKVLGPALMFAVLSAFFVFASYRDTTFGLQEQRQKLRMGNVSVVEGRVSDFVPAPYSGHTEEKFTVHGVSFSYSDYLIQPCFNTTRSHGGVITDGVWVRLSYEGNCILRIEVWKSGN